MSLLVHHIGRTRHDHQTRELPRGMPMLHHIVTDQRLPTMRMPNSDSSYHSTIPTKSGSTSTSKYQCDQILDNCMKVGSSHSMCNFGHLRSMHNLEDSLSTQHHRTSKSNFPAYSSMHQTDNHHHIHLDCSCGMQPACEHPCRYDHAGTNCKHLRMWTMDHMRIGRLVD